MISENIIIKNKKEAPQKFEINDLVTAQEYLEWKEAVPAGVRRQVEAVIKSNKSLSSQTGLVLSDQFLDTLGRSLVKKNKPDLSLIDKRVSNLLRPLERIKTESGYINAFETLINPATSWNLKRKIYEMQIKPALDWFIQKDLEKIIEESRQEIERKEGSDENQKENDLPPEQSEAISSMESGEQEKKEGEPTRALFSVKPFFGGYASDKEFDRLGENFRWQKSERAKLVAIEMEQYDLAEARIISGKVRGGQLLALPIYDNWTVDLNFIQTNAPEDAIEILQDERGKYYLKINAEGNFSYAVRIALRLYRRREQKSKEIKIGGELPEGLLDEIKKLTDSQLPKMKLKREIAKLVRNHLTYSNSREAWDFYTANAGQEFFKRVWERKEADCFVANTLVARALAEIDRDTVLVGGYYVKEKDENGNAIMHQNNGHGWIKTWDELSNRYVRLDATPKGDPTVDEQQQEIDLEGDPSSDGGEGDYGETDDELMPKEKLKERIRKMKGEKEEQKKLVPVNFEETHFAELAECSPEQAREFLKALDRVREIKNERGISISELLKSEWRKIVTERKIESNDYRGPVRMNEGDILEDPVGAVIDIRSQEFNPTGFEKLEKKEKIETEFGGINIYFSFDLSGSMKEVDGASGRSKADVQSDVALLFADSLMQCADVSRQQGENSYLLPIKIMVTLASDTGDVKLHLTDKWGPKEQWAFYCALNQLAKGGTPTHETLKKIEIDFDKENADLKKKKISKEKLPLHYTVEVSDGDPNDLNETEAMHKKLKAKGMVVRSYCIGGESTSDDAAPSIESFSQLPEILAEDIIEKFKKLNPKRISQ